MSQEETQGKGKNKSFPCSEIRLTLGILLLLIISVIERQVTSWRIPKICLYYYICTQNVIFRRL